MSTEVQLQILEELKKLNKNMDRFMIMNFKNAPVGAEASSVGTQGINSAGDIGAQIQAQIAEARQQAQRIAGNVGSMSGFGQIPMATSGRNNTE